MKKKLTAYIKTGLKTALIISFVFAVPVSIGFGITAVQADQTSDTKRTVRGSGLPVPRFVTLKFDEANLRAGPGREYPVLWQYRKTGLPLLVDAEFGVWRKVVDHEGTSGWMHGSVLSLRRMALVRENMTEILNDDRDGANIIALAERNALLELHSCPKNWCHIISQDIDGWIKRTSIWGVLADESLK